MQVAVVEQQPWEYVEYKFFAMWVFAPGIAARNLDSHVAEPEDVANDALCVEQMWSSLREAINAETEEAAGSKEEISMVGLAAYITLKSCKTQSDVENLLHDEFTAVQELVTWEQPITEDDLSAPDDLGGQETEESMKKDLWEVIYQANRQDGDSEFGVWTK